MVQSNAKTVEAYLAELPEDRRQAISTVRDLILENLPEGYVETMNWGMIAYEIPLERYPDTYNGRPLGYLALAAQKSYNALYLWGVYSDPADVAQLKAAFEAEGKKLDMGKSCLRFRRVEDLPMTVIGELVGTHPPERLIEMMEATRRR